MSVLKIQLLRPQAQAPCRQTPGSAGYDIHACLEEAVTIAPGECRAIPSGFAMELENAGLVGLIFARSSLGTRHGVVPANCVGVIDSDYRGEVQVCLRNQSQQPFVVQPGDRIAQLVILPVQTPQVQLCETLDESQRGEGGFGSTGRR